jgi:hypothetical protein
MKTPSKIVLAAALVALGGCSATTDNVGTVVLPTSNKKIDVVQHRTDNKGCTTGFVLQTYNHDGAIIDSKGGYGTSLGCRTVDGLIRAGGQVGAAALIADGIRDSADRTTITNSNNQSQAQAQSQSQTSNNTNTNTAQGGAGGGGGGGQGGEGGNNNHSGGGDGTNPGGHGNDGGLENPGNGN